ncbi:MAG TPA: DUF6378 domain-containing protein [Candidatus Pacearchaeota archaeon]|jgi:hypothetical protein|nr:DUF6378 domain-containing protein [Candidatus Pacearchaeota archaeon]|tara:strand:- start:1479 stop:1829 length:351 start_codon:yes stop_codon:yes gene_type:complete
MKTKDFLNEAIKLASGQRQMDYGDKTENHRNIAQLWSAYLEYTVSPHDVAILMCLLKVARTKLGAVSKDTYMDMSAYSAIAGEIKFNEPKKEEEEEGERRGRETAEYIKSLNKNDR